MDSQVSKKRMTEEEFRSCYPDVSIQHLTDKASPRVVATVEKHIQVKTPLKQAPIPKTLVAKSQVTPRLQPIKTPQNSIEKTNLPATKMTTPNTGKTLVQTKLAPVVKSPITPKTNTHITKSPVVTNTPSVTKTPVTNKTPVAAKNLFIANKTVASGVTVKTTPTPTKVSTSVLKTPVAKLPIVKTPQNVVKQQTVNAVKQQTPNVVKGSVSTPTTKEDAPDQSTMVLTYHLSPTVPQRPSKQLTIEKIDQQRIPVLDSSNQVVLQQVINNGQLVLQNRVTPVETTVQSVVIGTTAQAAVTPMPQVEITTSEPLQALQVTQQVTLFGPKGNKFTVDDVKKQINLNNKQNAMTNVVSSTTNSIPAPVPVPTQSVQQEQKKVVLPVNRAQTVKSPVRQSRVSVQQRGQVLAQQYNSTRGQTKNVSPKREIPMQKVSPMQPPPPPPPQMLATDQLGNEEEVTTSDDTPQLDSKTKILVMLPSGESKEIMITDDISLNWSLQEILTKHNIEIPLHVQQSATADITSQSEAEYQLTEGTEEGHWENMDTVGPEPGEILGLQDDSGTGKVETIQTKITQEDELQKEASTEPVFREGLLAVCGFCGMSSNNFSRCPRCTRPIPPDCKTISSESLQVRTSEKSKQSHAENEIPKFSLDELIWKSRKTKADSLTAESPKKKRTCKRKRLDEPVCLTISDDEELLGLAHHTLDSVHSDSNSQMSSCDKEPVITDDMVSELKQSVSGGGLDTEERLDNASPSERTYLQCRTVRIGSYKVVPKDRVLITPYGLKFTVPVLSSDQYVELKIMYHEIIKVLMHFGRQMPVLFFYTRPTAAAKIRKALRMEDKNGYYYDTTSSDETHRRITFLPDKIDDDCKSNLKNIFGNPENNIFAELTGKEANDILVKASPKEVQAFILKRQPNNNQPQQPQPFDGQNIQTIMVYPPPPEKGGIPINTEDYACLGEDQFLNDVIIDFYLKYVVEKTLSPVDRARTHVFSSFFYKRLTTKPPAKRRSMNPVENDPAASPAAKRHSRVKSWTKNVNLFNKDFIVIPINENSHWFLAIVCFPGLTGPVRFSDNTPIELPGRKKKVDGRTVTIGSTTITSPRASMVDVVDEGEDRDEADGEDEDMDVPDCEEEPIPKAILPDVKEEEGEEQIAKKKQQREPIKQPCILIFDSLAGASRSRVVATLRDYLRVEYEAKHGETRDFSGDVMKGSNVRCPQQTNYTDCGLYVLQYVEAFFQWPVTDYRIPIKQLQDWFQADIVSRKRYEIQQLLHRLMLEQSINIEALNLPLLNLRPGGKLVEDYSGTDEEEDDEDEHMCDDEEDMMEDDGDYHDEMGEEEEMEEGEIVHHDENDPENFVYQNMHDDDDDDHEMVDEMEYCMDEDEDELPEDEEEELTEKELDDLSLSHIRPIKGDNLKNYRIPRLATKNIVKTDNTFKDDQLD